MKDLFFYLQFLLLVLNITTLIFIMGKKYNYKTLRILLIIAVTIGMIINFGKITWVTVLFSFSPFLSLLNIKKDGQLFKYFERIIHHSGRGSKPMEKLQRSNKAISEQEA